MKKILASFLIAITLFCNLPINVYASELGGGGYAHKWVGWSDEEKKSFCRDKLTGAILQRVGILIQPEKWTSEAWTNAWNKHLGEIEIASGMTYDEYIMSLVSVDEDNEEFVISDSLLDSFHSVANIYIEENTGWFVVQTQKYDKFTTSYFDSKTQYDNFHEYFNSLDDNAVVSIKYLGKYCSGADNNQEIGCVFYAFPESTFYCSVVYNDSDFYIRPYDENWVIISQPYNVLSTASKNMNTTTYHNTGYGSTSGVCVYTNSSYIGLYSKYGTSIRVYKSLEDLKAYSVGQRPYFVTDAFNNYDSTVDNSITITQTEIDNSVTYGDVYNYITNNYENPDGLTEDELRAILAEYLSSINNSGGSGGSGGGSDSGGSGGGLSGFLDGLGSIGNAILAILGKLMEILGSAIELVTGAITDLITIIPNSIGELLGALFPVFPEEWIKAITLSLVLGVIVGIVRMFK